MTARETLRLPPQSIEAEQSLLGGLLLDSAAWDRIAGQVSEADFYRDDHRRIFRHIARLIEAGHPADVVTVFESLEKSAESEQAGGMAYLIEIANNTPSAANIRRYAEIVRERAAARKLQAVAKEIELAACGARDLGDVLAAAEKRLADVRESLGKNSRDDLQVVFAADLPSGFTPPDELVEGLLTECGGSVWYGESNSGKTFLLTSLGIAVALGEPWLGRRTERGIVVYIAAESPASIRARLQAFSAHHGVKVDDFAIVQGAVNLHENDADTEAIIRLIRDIERSRGRKVRLVVGDTLARLSAGANENSGEDMGVVLRRFDRIRTEGKAHFALIHHSGKNAAAGARGWSGIRAAVDTEIEVQDSPAGRCAEVTKQRDLAGKAERIGFRLEPVALGQTKWGKPASSCIVVGTDAPAKTAGKRVSEVAGAIVEFMRAQPAGIKKRAVVEHFNGIYDKSAIYRELKRMATAGAVFEVAGVVTLSEEVRKGAN